MEGGCSLELLQSLIESIAAVRDRASSAKEPHGAGKASMHWEAVSDDTKSMSVLCRDWWTPLGCALRSGHLCSGGLVSGETGVLRLTREWRVGVRRGERNSAWQSGRLTEGISAVHNTSRGWSAWERKKLFFLEDTPRTKPPHKPAMRESFLKMRS